MSSDKSNDQTSKSYEQELDKIITKLFNDWDKKHLNDNFIEENKNEGEQVEDDNVKTFLKEHKKSMEDLLQMLDLLLTGLEADEAQIQGLQDIHQTSSKLVLLGNTGSGKTASMHYLRGDELKCELDDCDRSLLSLADGSDSDIGNKNFESMTSICKIYESKDKKTVYIDCPGFKDSRGLVQQIKNAYYMKALSRVDNVKLILVVGFPKITDDRGEGLKEMLSIMESMFDIEKIKKSLSLIITKGPKSKNGPLRMLKEFSQQNTGNKYAELLASDQMETKIAVFPQIKEAGPVSGEWLEGLEEAINNSNKSTKLEFKLSLGNDGRIGMRKLAKLIQCYSIWLIKKKLEKKNDHIKKQIISNEYVNEGSTLKDQLAKEFDLSASNSDTFLQNLTDLTNDEDDKDCNLLQLSRKCLIIFSKLTNEREFDFKDWEQPFLKFKDWYSKFARPLKANKQEDSIRIEAPIVTTSEIKKEVNMSGIRSVDIVSYLFIIDEDLELPGIDLNVCTYRWQAYENKTISLKGKDGIGEKGGNFKAFARKTSNDNKITVDTSGGCGRNGSYDIYIKKTKEENQQKIKQIQNEINALEKLDILNNEVKRTGTNPEGQEFPETETRMVLNKLHHIQRECEKRMKELKKARSKMKTRKRVEQANNLNNLIRRFSEEIGKLEPLQDFNLYEESVDRMFRDLDKEANSLLHNETAVEEDELKRRLIEQEKITIDGQDLFVSAIDLQNLARKKKKSKDKLKEEQTKNENIEKHLKIISKKMQEFEEKMKKNLKQETDMKEKKELVKEHCKLFLKNAPDGHDFTKLNQMFEILNMAEELVKLDNDFEQLVVQKDNRIEGSLEMLNEFNLKIGGQLLTRNPDKEMFLNACKAEKEKLEKLLREVKSSQNQRLDQVDNEEMLILLKNYKKLKVKKRILAIQNKWKINTQTESRRISEDLTLLSKQINRFLKKGDVEETDGLFEPLKKRLQQLVQKESKSFDLLKMLYATNCKSYITQNKIDDLQTRINSAQRYIVSLSIVNDQFKNLKANLDLKITEFKNWKYSIRESDPDYQRLHKLLNDYDEIMKPVVHQKNDMFKLAEEILLNEINLVARVEKKWNNRDLPDKLMYIVKEILCFNKQFYEKYLLNGEQGGKGGDNGIVQFNHQVITEKGEPGKGGQSSFSLEGIYQSEKSFATLRNIKEVNETDKSHNVDTYLKSVTSSVIFTTVKTVTEGLVTVAPKAAFQGLGWALGGGFIGLQLLISPLIARWSSNWVSGPLKVTEKNGPDGNKLLGKSRDQYDEESKNLTVYRREISRFMSQIFPEEAD